MEGAQIYEFIYPRFSKKNFKVFIGIQLKQKYKSEFSFFFCFHYSISIVFYETRLFFWCLETLERNLKLELIIWDEKI